MVTQYGDDDAAEMGAVDITFPIFAYLYIGRVPTGAALSIFVRNCNLATSMIERYQIPNVEPYHVTFLHVHLQPLPMHGIGYISKYKLLMLMVSPVSMIERLFRCVAFEISFRPYRFLPAGIEVPADLELRIVRT